MDKTVLIIGTLDTKGAEIAYLRDRIQALGLQTIVVDDGILGEPLGITLEQRRYHPRGSGNLHWHDN